MKAQRRLNTILVYMQFLYSDCRSRDDKKQVKLLVNQIKKTNLEGGLK